MPSFIPLPSRPKTPLRPYESGAAVLLFVAALLPFLILTWALTCDVGGFLRSQREEQGTLDSAALIGAKGLPFVSVDGNEAKILATNFLLEHSLMLKSLPEAERNSRINVTVDAGRQGIAVELRGSYKINLAGIFSSIVREIPAEIPYTLQAKALITPRDVVIFFDKSRYLAPHVYDETSGDITEDKLNVWTGFRSGGYLSHYKAEKLYGAEERLEDSLEPEGEDPPPWREGAVFKRKLQKIDGDLDKEKHLAGKSILLTQQCFNPVWSAVKQAAIHTYDYLGNFPDNSVAVITGPVRGDDKTLLIHDLAQAGIAKDSSHGEGRFERSFDQAQLTDLDDDIEDKASIDSRVREQHCLFTADNARDFRRRWLEKLEDDRGDSDKLPSSWSRPSSKAYFAFPFYSSKLNKQLLLFNGRSDIDSRLTFYKVPGIGANKGKEVYGDGVLLPEAIKQLTTREAIWSQPVHRDRVLNFLSMLEVVGNTLIYAAARKDRSLSTEYVKSVAYIFLGDVPHAPPEKDKGLGRFTRLDYEDNKQAEAIFASIRKKIEDLSRAAADKKKILTLYLIFVRHPGRFCSTEKKLTAKCDEFLIPLKKLRNRLSGSSHPNVKVQVLPIPDIGSLAVEVPALLPIVDRGIVLTH